MTEHTSPGRLGAAVAVGVFVGTLPLYGLHLAICLGLAWLLRLNKATVYLAANISNPLFAPVLVAVSLAIGRAVRFGGWRPVDLSSGRDFLEKAFLLAGRVPDEFLSCLLGSVILGAALAAVAGPMVWIWARVRLRHRAAERPVA